MPPVPPEVRHFRLTCCANTYTGVTMLHRARDHHGRIEVKCHTCQDWYPVVADNRHDLVWLGGMLAEKARRERAAEPQRAVPYAPFIETGTRPHRIAEVRAGRPRSRSWAEELAAGMAKQDEAFRIARDGDRIPVEDRGPWRLRAELWWMRVVLWWRLAPLGHDGGRVVVLVPPS